MFCHCVQVNKKCDILPMADYNILFGLFILSSMKDLGMIILDEEFETV